ncbi:testis-specific serine/threonine-protein kinase 6-like [Lycorma delicatula]|uniref:testis-specific serine/threonine-protein kinase 6-like n=1 Tax=Lycorma delicatula TaxID=130591 RepID=UPI003F511857
MSQTVQVTESDKNLFALHGYTYDKLLGEGTYSKVWLVKYHKTSGDIIHKEFLLACKIIDTGRSPKDFTKKFLPRELDILIKINHPHLIHLHSIYQRRKKLFIFMRYAEKGDLLDHILVNGELKENRARLWARQLSLGLQYLHNLEIVHRDIKCENVLITINNNVKLADFGFSRFIVDSSGREYLSSTYCGSLAYSAPELLRGRPYDAKCSDIWSLGVVLFVMLNQCMPFKDVDMKKLYELQMNHKWNFRNRIISKITEDVKALVRGMIEPDPRKRMLIDDVVNSSWFSADDRLKVMSRREIDALESGIKKKSEVLPKSQKFSFQTWKKSKKDEQVIRMTSLRFERSSEQINLDSVSSRRSISIFQKPTGSSDAVLIPVSLSETENHMSVPEAPINQLQIKLLEKQTSSNTPTKIVQSTNLIEATETVSKTSQIPVQEETEEENTKSSLPANSAKD